jgi:uncharacterized protein YceK
MKRLLPVLAVALLLAGCSSPADSTAESPTPTPTETYASENEVASVIAEYEEGWRETIDAAGRCRLLWALRDSLEFTDAMEAQTCWLQELTTASTAELALLDLNELDIPPSMEDVAMDTKQALSTIVGQEPRETCGEEAMPRATEFCTSIVGNLNAGYVVLSGKLDAWKPWL